MAFDQSTITNVVVTPDDADLLVSWTSSSPAGTMFQLYLGNVLAWHGTSRFAVIPSPKAGVPTRIDVGTVAATEGLSNFSASLPAPAGSGDRVTLSWNGGSYLAADISGFHVYSGTTPGGAVSYTTPIAVVTAYSQGITSDGYGVGGYGSGGYGASGATYSWTSNPLAGGTWNFAVKPFDTAGNEGAASTTSAVIDAPPPPPAANAIGKRLTYTYNSTSHVATLNWLASA